MLLCASRTEASHSSAGLPEALAPGVIAGEHLRELGEGHALRAAAPPDWDQHDGVVVHRLAAGPDGVRTLLVRSADEARRDHECREELVSHLRTEITASGGDLADRLRGSRARSWITVVRGQPRLNEKAIERDAELDGHYLLRATTGRSNAGPVVAYLRFQGLARRAVRLAAGIRPALHPAIGPALTLMWAAEQRTGRPWAEIADQLAGVHAVTLAGGTVTRTRLTDRQSALLRAAGVPPDGTG